ncbi:MAG: glutamine--tRNA ligase/YqeY domain fusion protein [Candidatus Cloacimonetes bacterium]|nr:glutamine--tRNA ligase/YqeY domain fusion protein [Candidatus Cloacimonadota bacterium]
MAKTKSKNFIRSIIDNDLRTQKNGDRVVTRFPPEPNGFLHIGHAKSICLNFGIADDYNGPCHLRFDDTNPANEDTMYVDSIKEDVKWLGFDWQDKLFYSSDYFDKLYNYAIELIKMGKAYICELDVEQMREYRGTLTEAGKNSPFRDRSIEENLELFTKMANGDFEEGKYVLRAKIDMASPNLNMRDPAVYRVKNAPHHRTGDKFKIYPMYDYAHCMSDSIEGITHSLCTLEFENHRPLYDWFIDELDIECHPQQIEFARLNINYTVLSKRKLLELVETKAVNSWDDPRLPTIAGLRRRGYTPGSIKEFCSRIGIAKVDSTVDIALLEYCIREDLNKNAKRAMAILNPLKVVIENYPEDKVEYLKAKVNPEDPNTSYRELPFTREIFIDHDDFMENPPEKYFRLQPGGEVKLKNSYFIKCQEVIKDQDGNIIELRCTYDQEAFCGKAADGRKVKGTAHWVSAKYAQDVEVRLYDRLFKSENPQSFDNYLDDLNPNSLTVLHNCKIENNLGNLNSGDGFQFERTGYFCVDKDSTSEALVFNRTVSLKDSFKIKKK